MNLSAALVADMTPPTATVTSTVPDPGGLVTVQLVVVQLVTIAATVPKSTVSEAAVVENPVPVTVTAVAPAGGPALGLMAVTVGPAPAAA
jgi:hypothetical protein